MLQRYDNRNKRLLVLVSVTLGGIALAASAYAFDGKPTTSIKIPTIKFTDVQVEGKTAGGGTVDIPWLAEYISGIYRYSVGFGTIIGTVMIIIGGFQYLTAGGDASRVKAGKDRITDSVVGMLLLIGSYVILSTVNPDLVSLKSLSVQVQKGKYLGKEPLPPPVLESLEEKAKTAAPQFGATAPPTGPPEPDPDQKSSDAGNIPVKDESSDPPTTPTGSGSSPKIDVPLPVLQSDFKSLSDGARKAILEPYVRAAAKAWGVPYKLVCATVWQESRWMKHDIGHDENFVTSGQLVSSRVMFLRSGKMFSGKAFSSGIPGDCATPQMEKPGIATPEQRALCLRIHGNFKFVNDDDKVCDTKPDYCLDWRFSHGLGIGMATIFTKPSKNQTYRCPSGDRGITYDSGPPYGSRCYTPAELITVEGGVDAMMRELAEIYRRTKRPECVFGGYIGGGCDGVPAKARMKQYYNCPD